ncbi:MAG: hypothetical protein KAH56_03120 [Candidatus Krumholzibacteria bacterium]|nr:hypothetical protein [Candidatus Krumholzibacteria bacterium]
MMTGAGSRFLTLRREAHFFSARPLLAEKLERTRKRILLAPDQLLHPEVPMAYIVRLGKLRVTQFLPAGPEVTRAVLQAGTLLMTENISNGEADPTADVYHLSEMVLMALGEVELWALPTMTLEQD